MRKYQLSFLSHSTVKLVPKFPRRDASVPDIMARKNAEVHDLAFVEAKMAEFGVRRIETPANDIVAAILERITGVYRKTNVEFEATEEQAVLIKMFLNVEAPVWWEIDQ